MAIVCAEVEGRGFQCVCSTLLSWLVVWKDKFYTTYDLSLKKSRTSCWGTWALVWEALLLINMNCVLHKGSNGKKAFRSTDFRADIHFVYSFVSSRVRPYPATPKSLQEPITESPGILEMSGGTSYHWERSPDPFWIRKAQPDPFHVLPP